MRLKLILSTSLFTALAALVTSCSKNSSVVDDWPGIDELVLVNEAGSQALTPGDSFTLKSSLNLPRMGKDVSFTLKAECKEHRGKNQRRNYRKISTYTADKAKSLVVIPVVDILPEQTLIFPDYFEKCHFSLNAWNQYGSTQTETLKDQKFEFEKDKVDLKLTANINLLKGAISAKDMQDITVSAINKQKVKNSKLTCLAGTRGVTLPIISESVDEIRGDILTLPETEKDHPVENCIVRAESAEGKLLLSNRIQILNAELAPPPKVEVFSTILDEDPTGQIFYDNFVDDYVEIIEFSLRGTGDADLEFFRMEKGEKSTVDLSVISDLSVTSRNFDGLYVYKTYDMNTIGGDGAYVWSPALKGIFRVNDRQTTTRYLALKPDFKCVFVDNHELSNAELGFVLTLTENSPELNIQKVIENDFTTDVITTYNLLKLANSNLSLSNVPDSEKTENGISVLFRNNSIAPDEPLELSSKVMTMRYGKDGEPVPGFENKKSFPFMTRAVPNKITCSSASDFKEKR